MRRTLLLFCILLSCRTAGAIELMGAADLGALAAPAPELKLAYGEDPLEFGHLRLPTGDGPHPVIILIHGGCWLAQYDIAYLSAAEQALADAGYAVWSIEYRRVGDAGGGWPETYRDVGRGVDHLRTLAREYPLDLDRIVVSGHSAGGALAAWVAARTRISTDSELHVENPLPVQAMVGLAPAMDIEAIEMADHCGDVINTLMGGAAHDRPERYRAASPMQLLPTGIPHFLVMGAHDDTWQPTGQSYHHRAAALGDPISAIVLPDAGHFEMIAPASTSWPAVMDVFRQAFEGIGNP